MKPRDRVRLSQLRRAWLDIGLKLPNGNGRVGWRSNAERCAFVISGGELRCITHTGFTYVTVESTLADIITGTYSAKNSVIENVF